jgi:hypothetical protein
MPINGATTVTLSQVPLAILIVSRAGVVQSAVDGNYTLAGSVITFTDALNGSERVIVDYSSTSYTPALPINGGTGIADNTITSAKIADGTIATVDLANAAVTNAKLGADTARANLLTNGGFEIWQRGNGPLTTTGAYTADRWLMLLGGGTSAMDVSRAAVTNYASTYAALIHWTKGTGGVGYLYQSNIEVPLTSATCTFAIDVFCDNANAVRAWLENASGTKIYSAYHAGGNGWQRLSITTPTKTGASAGLEFNGSWSGYCDNAMLVVGSVPADYAPMHPADDLARCMRYYENADVRNAAYGIAAEQMEWWITWITPKAVSPTVTMSGGVNNINISPILCTFQNYKGADFYGQVAATGHVLMNPTYAAEANP